MEVEKLPNLNLDEIKNEMSSGNIKTTLTPTEDMTTSMVTEQIPHNGDGFAVLTLDYPSATSSKTKYNSVSTKMKKKEIKEFIRVLRPHLPRKSKSKAYKMLQNIGKGIVVKSSFQQRIRKRRPKKRPVRQEKKRQLKTKSLSIMRRSIRSLCSSSDSCRSNITCSHCGYSDCRIANNFCNTYWSIGTVEIAIANHQDSLSSKNMYV